MPLVSANEDSANPEQLVYLTRTGTKYHRDGCRFLARSRIPTHLKDVGSHGPCSVCKPPTLSDGADRLRSRLRHRARVHRASAQPADGGRCQAVTKKGTQCSRKAQAGSDYCWQHQK